MIILLRGHIRNSFQTNELYELIHSLSKNINVKIYIHTWHILQSNISWREIPINNTEITEEYIYSYFKELKHLIKKILIEDDKNIQLVGNTKGNIGEGPAPLIGWKNYWYGQYKLISYLKSHTDIELEKNEAVVNMRFDLFSNFNAFCYHNFNGLPISEVRDFIEKNKEFNSNKNIFMKDQPSFGIDNIYIGNISTIHKLVSHFHYFLDNIFNKYTTVHHQEFLVFLENDSIF